MELPNLYRTATPEELSFYEDQLYPLQDEVLKIASIYEQNIYLTGGTALSRFYYEHRFSDDLDFLTTTDDLRAIANDLAARLQQLNYTIEIQRLDIYFARFFVVRPNCRLKIEFVKEFNLVGELTKTDRNIYVNSLEDLGANKVSAFEDRAEIKDIIDLYFITQTIPLERLFELADFKRIPVAYDRLLAINSQGISGKVLMRQDLDVQTLRDFLAFLKQRTEAEVKKKIELASQQIPELIDKLLWDFPKGDRSLNPASIPVLKRRLKSLSLPEREALLKAF